MNSRLLRAFAICVLFAACPRGAFAHATPMVYQPAASAVLERAPERVQINFSERVEPKASSITIFGPDGNQVEAKDGAPDPKDNRIFSVGMRGAGDGVYTVSWQVVSQDDGHFTKGGFSFIVGMAGVIPAGATSRIQVEHSSLNSQAAAIGTELVGQSMLIAFLAALALLWRSFPGWKISELQASAFQRSCSRMVVVGGTLMVAGVLAFLVLKTLDLQGSRSTPFLETMQTFLTTVDGRFAMYRAIIAVVFVAVFFAARKKMLTSGKVSAPEVILFILIVLTLVARARVSHAAASHILPNFSIAVNAVHLLAKEFWVGGLMAVTLIFIPILSKAGRAAGLAHTLTLMSKHISVSLAVTGITGAYIVWLHLKSPDYILTTQWGSSFMVLSAFAGMLAAIRLVNQTAVDGSVIAASFEPQRGWRKDTASMWRNSLSIEMWVGIAVLFVTSQLIITTPPYPPEKYGMEKKVSSQGTTIALSVHPFDKKQFLLSATDEKTAEPVNVSGMVVSLQNVEKNIGPVVAATEQRFEGGFTFPRNEVAIPGLWTIDVTVQRTESYDAVASFQLNTPKDVEESLINPDERHFGAFEGVIAAVALASLIGALVLYRFSDRLNARAADIDPRRGLSDPVFKPAKSMGAGVVSALLVAFVVWTFYDTLVKTEFQTSCEAGKGSWTEAAPMRAGVVLASDTVTGCTVQGGSDHFVDFREYSYFLHKPTAKPHH